MSIGLSRAYAINNAGLVIGDVGGNPVAASWTATGGLNLIGDLTGSTTSCCSELFDVNASGAAVGNSVAPLGGIAVLQWDQATNARTNLGQYRGNTRGRGINDAGDVAGQSDGGVPFFLPNGGPFLGLTLAPFGAAFVTGLNNGGTVAGWVQGGLVQRAAMWPDHASPLVDLGSLGGDISRAEAINDAGDIVGWSEITPGNPLRHAVLWPATGGVIDLATWPGHCAGSSVALGINNAGVIVGHCDAIPVLWTAQEGMRYLPNPRGSGEPRGINDRLEIVGTAPTGFGGALWKLDNNPPVANPRGPSTGNEGDLLVFDGSGSFDADGDALTYDWSLGDGGTGTGIGPAHAYDDNGVYEVTLTVTDARGAVSPTASMGVSIGNVAPTITSLVLPLDPVPVRATVTASGNFTDPSSLDTHTATVDWDDGAGALAATVDGRARTFTASRAFTAAGVYTVTVTVTDDDRGSTTLVGTDYVVVYDPSAGFVTGGGWITSPAGSCVDPGICGVTDAGGKATFGFVSKYKKGATAPIGNTEFQYHVAGLNFSSTLYQWLVVAGARAQYKGEGTINGGGSYGFLITGIDGQQPGAGGIDRFRIKSWDLASGEVVYDNQLGAAEDSDASTALGGGGITIHP